MISNFRDLGGIKTKDGKCIPCGMLFRSANLHKAVPKDLEGITAVIDLRTETERGRMPDIIPDHISYHMIPIFDEATAGITREMTLSSVPDMVALYRKMIVSCQSAIQKVLSVIYSHDFSSGGILWHCTAGKDRCGVITAYVLASLGVSQEDIMEDYMKSNEACLPEAEAIMSQLAGKNLSEAELKGVWDAFIAKEDYLQSAFSEMRFDENQAFKNTVFSDHPMHIKITPEGGSMLDYCIMEKAPFTIVGIKRRFNSETSYQEIPKYWNEWMSDKKGLTGMFGVCLDMDGKDFDYWIADLYAPWKDIQEGCETYQIPGSYWAQFVCRGPLPDSLQNVNTQIWSEWLPSLSGYELAGNYSIEFYMPPAENPADTVNYIWIPLKKA